MPNDTIIVRDRRPGYLRVYNDLYDRFGSTLGPYGLAVYVALCRYADQDSECYPSYNTIAKGTGMSRKQAIREVAKMEKLGLIEVERNQHTSNVFVLLDTRDTQSPLPGTTSPSPRDTQSPKQDLIKKNTRRGSDKKEGSKKNYRPDEYADIII
jgi:hypothetical protein